MRTRRVRLFVKLIPTICLVAAACGGGASDGPGEAAATTVVSTPVESDSPTTTMGADAAGDTSSIAPQTETDNGDDSGGEGGGDLSLVPPGETDIVGNPAGQGFVELDGTRYDFVLNGACQKIFGAVQVAGTSPSDSDVGVGAIIPPEDWETDTAAGWDPPYVEIGVGDDSWRAEIGAEHFIGGETVVLTPEQSAVTAFTNDGSRVTGTANFFSEFNFDEVESQSGSFDFYCP